MIAAVVTTYYKQFNNLGKCLSFLRQGVDEIICSCQVQGENQFIPSELTALCDYIIYHHTFGQYQGEIASTKTGFAIAALHADYILKLNGDVFMTKPEGLKELVPLIEDNDIAAPQWHNHYRYCSTLLFFGKAQSLLTAYRDVYCPTRLPQLERKWFDQIKAHQLKLKIVPMAEERADQAEVSKNGYWGEVMGLRHLHGEYPADG